MDPISKKMTREISIGSIKIGGNNPIAVQCMTMTQTKDIQATVSQIKELEALGCDIIRVSVTDMEDARALKEIKERISIPLVADVHFDYRLAIESAKYADKLRINPGNIGSREKIKKVLDAANERNIPIRIGVNLGSLEKDVRERLGPTPEAMVESALKSVRLLEGFGFTNIVVALKASDVRKTVRAYELFSEKCDYPLHIGITEAGTRFSGTIRSSIGIGSLLLRGIGDTIRVSLTEHPSEEVKVAIEILKALGLKEGRTIISCPTCGRTKIDIMGLTRKIDDATKHIKKNIKIAVMGCVVNGPGEAMDADIGIAGGDGCAALFKHGKIIKKVDEDHIVEELLKEIEGMV